MNRSFDRQSLHATRFVWLDVLRAVACVLVIASHTHGHYDYTGAGIAFGIVRTNGGGFGVSMFFVLSGFLVSRLLFNEYLACGRIRVTRFLVRRGLKIYPAFYFFFITTVTAFYLRSKTPALYNLLGEVLFLQNYVGNVWGYCWTLAVEEHFYLAIAVLIGVASSTRNGLRLFPAIALGVIVLCPVARWCRLEVGTMSGNFQSHLRADALMPGALIAYWYCFVPELFTRTVKKYSIALSFTAACLCLPIMIDLACAPIDNVWRTNESGWKYYCGYTLLSSAQSILLSLMLVYPVRQWRVVKLLAWAGRHSYSIYLWHAPIMGSIVGRIMRSQGWDGPFVEFLLSVPMCIGGGVIASMLVEAPILAMRDRFVPSRQSKQPL